MAVSNTPWSQFSDSDYSDDQYTRATILDMADCQAGMASATPKQRYKLPIREPSGALNRGGIAAAAAALAGARGGMSACAEAKRKAAGRLVRAYREAEMEPPDSLRRMAGG